MPTIFRDVVELYLEGAEVGEELTFNDPGGKPTEAQYWNVDVLDGWDQTPDVTVYTTELGGGRDGDVDADFFPVRSRFVIMGGYVLAPTAARARELYNYIISSGVPRNREIKLYRYEADETKFLTCRRSGPVEAEWSMPNGFRWQTTLKAADPFKYALAEDTVHAAVAGASTSGVTFPIVFPLVFSPSTGGESTSAGVYNRGNAPSSRIVAELTGPLTRGGWRLRNDTTGEEVSIDIGLAVGDTLTLDFMAQKAVLNGYPISSSVIGTFWNLAPGNNTIRLYADYDPAAGVDIYAHSAWE